MRLGRTFGANEGLGLADEAADRLCNVLNRFVDASPRTVLGATPDTHYTFFAHEGHQF